MGREGPRFLEDTAGQSGFTPANFITFAQALSGGLRFNDPPFEVTAPNITPDPETGIGKWNDVEIKKLLQEGIGPSDVHVAEVMPAGFYKFLTPGDLDGALAAARTSRFAWPSPSGAELGGRAPSQPAVKRAACHAALRA
jgi:hypothetical protein